MNQINGVCQRLAVSHVSICGSLWLLGLPSNGFSIVFANLSTSVVHVLYILLPLSINVCLNIVSTYGTLVPYDVWYTIIKLNAYVDDNSVLLYIIIKYVLSNTRMRNYFWAARWCLLILPLIDGTSGGASIRHPTPCCILNLHLGSVVIRTMLIWNSSFLVPRTHLLRACFLNILHMWLTKMVKTEHVMYGCLQKICRSWNVLINIHSLSSCCCEFRLYGFCC
jgi:hypothetical protein